MFLRTFIVKSGEPQHKHFQDRDASLLAVKNYSKMDVTYQPGDMSDYICVEMYLIQNIFNKVSTKLQQTYKPILVYDYLNKNGYQKAPKQKSRSWTLPQESKTRSGVKTF